MTIYTRVEFECSQCKAQILYEDELPIILPDRAAQTRNNKAIKFVKQRNLKYTSSEHSELDKTRPPNVTFSEAFGIFKYHTDLEKEKYIQCVVCQARIYI